MKSKIIVIAAALILLLGWSMLWQSQPPVPSGTTIEVASNVPPPEAPVAHVADVSLRPPAVPRPATMPQTTNLIARIIHEGLPDLTVEQLEPYLHANHRDAASLLTAYRATHKRELLDEAIANFPNDPRVAYTAWYRTEPGPDDPDGLKARRQALDKFEQVAPDNSLANYLSAANYFKTGHPDQAMQEMQAGASKTKFDDYTQEAILGMQEAYQTAGYSEVEAKLAATTGALLPHLAELKQDGLSLLEAASKWSQSGDTISAQSAMQMSLDLGQRLSDPNSMTLIQQLVGLAIQRKAYDAMAAATTDPAAGQEIQDRIKELQQYRDGIKNQVSSLNIETWLQTASPEDISGYIDRERLLGEQRAMQWLANRQKQ